MVASDLDLPTMLRQIVHAAMELTDARYGALGVVGDDQFLSEFIHEGMAPDLVDEIGHLPEGHGILGLLIAHPEPIRLPDLGKHPNSFGFPPGHPPMKAFIGVPVRVGGRVFGNLYLTEKRAVDEFSADDEELVVALAAVAGASIERSRLQASIQQLALIEDRERIGRDLHDTVIQRLFATGLGLQAIASRSRDRPELAERIEAAVEDLDETIRDIRRSIFELQSSDAPGSGLRRTILALAQELAGSLGLTVRTIFDGPIDAGITDAQAEHVAPVVREGLSNVARHAGASQANVRIALVDGTLSVEVSDDGVGPGPDREGGRGLANVTARAEGLGGTAVFTAGDGGGSVLRWMIPLT